LKFVADIAPIPGAIEGTADGTVVELLCIVEIVSVRIACRVNVTVASLDQAVASWATPSGILMAVETAVN